MSAPIVDFERGEMWIMHPPADWDGSMDMLLEFSHPENQPCLTCILNEAAPHAIGVVTAITYEKKQ